MSDDPRRTGFCTPTCYRVCQCSRWPDMVDRWGNPVNHGSGVAADNDLLNSLSAYWTMDEFSASVGPVTRADSLGISNLTDVNTCPSGTGIIGNGVDLELAATQYLWCADNANLSAGDTDFTFSAWVRLESKPASIMNIISKETGGAATTEYMVRWENTTDRFEFYIAGAGYIGITANTFGAPNLATWYLIICWHDSVANTINICVNNGVVDSQATGVTVPNDTATAFGIGATVPPSRYFDGIIDEVGMWKSAAGGGGVLTAAQRTALYNGGAGLAYADFTL